jgi:antitoxin HigA-1
MGRFKKLPPIHPGEILLEEFLKPLGMSMNKLAEELHVPANRITQIVEGRRGVTGETALRLARYFGTSAEFWLGMQKDYDLQVARDEFETKVEREVRPRDRRPDERWSLDFRRAQISRGRHAANAPVSHPWSGRRRKSSPR